MFTIFPAPEYDRLCCQVSSCIPQSHIVFRSPNCFLVSLIIHLVVLFSLIININVIANKSHAWVQYSLSDFLTILRRFTFTSRLSGATSCRFCAVSALILKGQGLDGCQTWYFKLSPRLFYIVRNSCFFCTICTISRIRQTWLSHYWYFLQKEKLIKTNSNQTLYFQI